jgi:hypothetical protein
MSTTPAGWLADSTGRHQYRYWDGTQWTDHVADDGVAALDPLATPTKADTPEQETLGTLSASGRTESVNAISGNDPATNRLNELLDGCMCGHVQEHTAELFQLTGARPSSVAPDRSIWAKFAAFIERAESVDQKLTAVKMAQFAIFWHNSAYHESADALRFYLGTASPDQLRMIRLAALACCKDLDPATVVIPAAAGGDTAGELVVCEMIELSPLT